jgi:hypothetical protein
MINTINDIFTATTPSRWTCPAGVEKFKIQTNPSTSNLTNHVRLSSIDWIKEPNIPLTWSTLKMVH